MALSVCLSATPVYSGQTVCARIIKLDQWDPRSSLTGNDRYLFFIITVDSNLLQTMSISTSVSNSNQTTSQRTATIGQTTITQQGFKHISFYYNPPMQCMQCTMHKLGSSYEHVRLSVRLSVRRVCVLWPNGLS